MSCSPHWLRLDTRVGCLSLDVGDGSITTDRQLVVPTAVLVLVRNARRISGDTLFPGGVFCSSAGCVVAPKRVPEPTVNAGCPAAPRLDDFKGNPGHLWPSPFRRKFS